MSIPQASLDKRFAASARWMERFAEASGLVGDRRSRRYLWTDAFAVCNYVALFEATGEQRYLDSATRLVDQVHEQLGRHRTDDTRQGWISGLPEDEGRQHPTRGGLRIGKPRTERQVNEPFDERSEWDRDGQYYHYLTKWMHALHVAGLATGESRYHQWAGELAIRAQQGFMRTARSPSPGRGAGKFAEKRLVWKMSIELDRPLVDSTGQHDPLDGLITCWELSAAPCDDALRRDLQEAAKELQSICSRDGWATSDPLGIGGLLFDAARLAQLLPRGIGEGGLLPQLLFDALRSLQAFAPRFDGRQSADDRLAFRELGLAIGLHGLDVLTQYAGHGEAEQYLLTALARYRPLADDIESFWLQPASQTADTWTEHHDINAVMLATSLAPSGFFRA